MSRIPDNKEHREALAVTQRLVQVMHANGVNVAHQNQSVQLIKGDTDIRLHVVLSPLDPVGGPILNVDIELQWVDEDDKSDWWKQ